MYTHNRKIISIALALTLILSSFSLAFAAHGSVFVIDSGERTVAVGNISVERISNTSGETVVDVGFSERASWVSCTATLQEKNSSGNWVTATGVDPISQYEEDTNTAGIYMVSYWELTKGKVYRIKAVLKDTVGGSTYTNTYYSGSF